MGYLKMVTEGYPTLLQTPVGTKNIQEQGRGARPAIGLAKDLKGLEKPPTVRMKLGRSKVKVVQNFNLKVGERKPNLKLMPQRFQHHDIGTFPLRCGRAESFLFTRDD